MVGEGVHYKGTILPAAIRRVTARQRAFTGGHDRAFIYFATQGQRDRISTMPR